MSRAGVSVVIPTRGRRRALAEALDAISRAAARVDEPVEAIVVDDRRSLTGTEPTAEQVIDGLPVRTLSTAAAGVSGAGAARNLGAAAAAYDLLAFTDDDGRCDPHWIAAGIARLRAAPELAGVEGAVRIDPLRAIDPLRSRIVQNLSGGGFLTASMFVRADAFQRIGGFRRLRAEGEWGFDWREDSDLGRRLQAEAGPVPFAADAIVYHPADPVRLPRLLELAHLFVADAVFVRLHPAAAPPVWRSPLVRLRIRLATAIAVLLPALIVRRLRLATSLALALSTVALSAQFESELRDAGLDRSPATQAVTTIRRVPRTAIWALVAGGSRLWGEMLVRSHAVRVPAGAPSTAAAPRATVSAP